MTRCKLSVNVNKIATIRNARGGHIPDLILAATRIESYGAHGITVHPRPDERHVRYDDVRELSKTVKTELNVEGYPSDDWMELVMSVKPTQATLVPDPPGETGIIQRPIAGRILASYSGLAGEMSSKSICCLIR